jgi:protein TonB
MKRFDENDVAKRLGGQTPPPPPELAARIKGEIPEHVEVPAALTRRHGTLPFVRRPLGRRLLALAAILLVGIGASLVARRVLRPPSGPLQVALIDSVPSPSQEAALPAEAGTAVSSLQAAQPAPDKAPAAAPSGAGPQARAAALPAAPGTAEKALPEAASKAAGQAQAPPPQVAAEDAAVAPDQAAADAVVAGVEGGELGGVAGGVLAAAAPEADEEHDAATVYRVGGPVTAPEPVHRVPPAYPEAARRAGLRGVVVIEVVIDRDGAVVRPRVVRNTTGSSECAEEALRAVRKWRYRPAQLEGRPVAAHLTLAIEFRPGTTGHKATAGPQPP